MAGSEDGGRSRDREDRYRRAALRHPLRQRIARLMAGRAEASAAELAGEVDEPLGRVGYHLRVLNRRGVLRAVPKVNPNPPRYRWSSQAQWARRALGEQERDG
jgi:DNA-binding transcriptional ArsR family regulator